MSDDLAGWLLEQIAEDEQTARDVPRGPAWDVAEAKPGKWGDSTPDTELIGGGKLIARFAEEYGGYLNALHAERWDPARVLVECDAKRKIIARYLHCKTYISQSAAVPALYDTLRELAEPYAKAGRPGYREEWKP